MRILIKEHAVICPAFVCWKNCLRLRMRPTLASGGGYKRSSLQPIIPNMLRAVMWLKKGYEITANHSPGVKMKGCGAAAATHPDALCSTFPSQ